MYDPRLKYTREYLSGLPRDDLQEFAQEARATRLALETNKAQGCARRPHLFKKVRRDIARMQTELRK